MDERDRFSPLPLFEGESAFNFGLAAAFLSDDILPEESQRKRRFVPKKEIFEIGPTKRRGREERT